MRKILFSPIAFDQYNDWQSENKQIHEKLKTLIKEAAKIHLKVQESQRR